MLANLQAVPWGMIGLGYVGLVVYILTTLANPEDETFSSVTDVFLHRGKTVLTAAIVVPILVIALRSQDQLTAFAAFSAGYMNVSLIRKGTETWMNKSKLLGGGQ